MNRFLRTLLLALQFFTRIPLPDSLVRWTGFSPDYMRQAIMHHMPAIGWLTGALAAGVFSIFLRLWATPVMLHLAPAPLMVLAAILSTAFTIWLTAGLHEDGLADVADALFGSTTPEQALQIMKDSRVGTYAVLVLVLSLLLKVSLLCALALLQTQTLLIVLLIAHVLSRFFPLILVNALPHVALQNQSKTRQMAGVISGTHLWPAALWCLPLVCVYWLPQGSLLLLIIGAALFSCAVITVWMGWWFKRRLHGFTGDCLGATQQICELICYVAALTVMLHTQARTLV